MSVNVHDRVGGPQRLVVDGALTVDNVDEFRGVSDVLVGNRAAIVDLERCTDLDAAGLGALIRCVRRIQEAGGRVVIAADAKSPLPRRLRHAGISKLAPVIERERDTERAA